MDSSKDASRADPTVKSREPDFNMDSSKDPARRILAKNPDDRS